MLEITNFVFDVTRVSGIFDILYIALKFKMSVEFEHALDYTKCAGRSTRAVYQKVSQVY